MFVPSLAGVVIIPDKGSLPLSLSDAMKWINGKIVLIEEDNLLWIKEFERPWNGTVSDAGRVLLVHTINRNYSRISSSPKEYIDLGSRLTVIERSGDEIFAYNFGSNIEACAISPNGHLASVATLMPDDSVYCFDRQQKKMLWKYKNHPVVIKGQYRPGFGGFRCEIARNLEFYDVMECSDKFKHYFGCYSGHGLAYPTHFLGA